MSERLTGGQAAILQYLVEVGGSSHWRESWHGNSLISLRRRGLVQYGEIWHRRVWWGVTDRPIEGGEHGPDRRWRITAAGRKAIA